MYMRGYSLPIMRQPIEKETVAAYLNSVLFMEGSRVVCIRCGAVCHVHARKKGPDKALKKKIENSGKAGKSKLSCKDRKDHSNWIGYVD